jgi:2-polyprenyl-3-methyl-5-hydroxy-6-metoxy-1,4-benzoquinol methylase
MAAAERRVRVLEGANRTQDPRYYGDSAFGDHKIVFMVKYCKDKDVLDIGCVEHNPQAYNSRFWLHKAVKAVARSILGLDLHEEGVKVLQAQGFNVILADAENFDLGRTFDVIVAGDIIEHLGDLNGFLTSCRKHLRPDGRLLISTPNPWYWRNIVKSALHKEVLNNPEHVVWICARLLRQLVHRHGMEVGEIQFGSRFMRDRLLPLPRGWKHTSYHAEVFEAEASTPPGER